MIEKEIHLTDGNDSVGYIRKALKEINSNKNHSFSAEEVQRLRDFEKNSKQSYAKLSSTRNEFSKNLEEGMKSFQIALKKIGRQSFQNLKNISEIGWYVSPNIIQKMSLIDLRLLSKKET